MAITFRHSGIVLGLLLFLAGCKPGAPTGSPATAIDRKTFSMSLPGGWTENKKDPMYDADSLVTFENADSCMFMVFVGRKSTGMSTDLILEKEKASFVKKFTEAKTSPLDGWAKYRGKGIKVSGMVGTIQYDSAILAFENGDNVCAVIEAATPEDREKYAADFELIRQSFKLK